MESFAPEVPSWQSNPQRTANLLRNDNLFRRSQFHVSILRTVQFSEYGDTNVLCSIYVLKDMSWSNTVDFYHFKEPSKGVRNIPPMDQFRPPDLPSLVHSCCSQKTRLCQYILKIVFSLYLMPEQARMHNYTGNLKDCISDISIPEQHCTEAHANHGADKST